MRSGWLLLTCGGLVLSGASVQGEEKGGTEVDLGGLRSTAPGAWESRPTTSPMRLYHFRLPGDKGSAELTIFAFRGGQGGSASANVERWKGMFVAPEGKTIDDVARVEHPEVGGTQATYLDVSGTYKYKARPFDPKAQAELRPDHRMLAVVLESKGGPFYIRLVGPASTVDHHKKAFDDWLKAFK